MSRIPPPPTQLSERELPLFTLRRRAAALVRLAWADPSTHLPFRTDTRFRFDAPDGSFGVVYAAFDLDTAFVETILRDKPPGATAPAVMLDDAELRDRRVITLDTHHAVRPLRLVKLYDDGLVALRLDNRISSVDDYDTTRAWAKVLHDHPQEPDGIVYLSRYLGRRRTVVLFDRSHDQLATDTATPLLKHPELAVLLDRYFVGIHLV